MKKFIRNLVAKSKSRIGHASAGKPLGKPETINRNAAPSQADDHVNANMEGQQQILADAPPGTLALALQNRTTSNNVFAYITGLALNDNNRPIFIQSDGRTVYSPTSPDKPLVELAQDVAIPLGAPGNTVSVYIPKIAGGRIWFSVDARLKFLVNPGPSIVEPSVTNTSDANINLSWAFCEFTYNDAQLFANISYVDFISVPVGMSLTNTAGQTQSVPGMPTTGFDTIVNELRAQSSRDGRPWDQLIYSHNGKPLRVLSPNNLMVGYPNAWDGYWDSYVDQVWSKFTNEDMTINTQVAAGNLTGRVVNNELSLGEAGTFTRPSARDIFTCATGPFATGSNQARNAVIPRLSAAFNRSTLLDTNQFPNGSRPEHYYRNPTTNHYSRIVHSVQRDGRGYAFPYDDVVPDGGTDVAGTIFDGSPKLFTITIGGG